MFQKFVKLSAMAAAANAEATDASDHWAVIVVGSNGFGNYRHHADGCHAYQQAIANGIPEENIIMMAYDDVANDSSNPFKGKLFNKASGKEDGVDVYEGCKMDYWGREVTADNLLKALRGEHVGKHLMSNANSKIFFAYFDHGAPGLLGMPREFLTAIDLMDTFKYMFDNKMYKEMVVYIEACESGSIFKNLPTDMNIYALSAANAKESSWGTYCDPDDVVKGKHIGSCLGDLFSVNWMDDLDNAVKNKQTGTETLKEQFETTKQKTTKSHVLQWGDLTIGKEVIGAFETASYSQPKNSWAAFKNWGKSMIKDQIGWDDAHTARKNDFAVDVRDIDMHYLYTKVSRDPSEGNQNALMAELNKRINTDKRFEALFPTFFQQVKDKKWPDPETKEDFKCYMNLIDSYTEECGMPDTYTMKYFGNFLHQCKVIQYNSSALDEFKAKLASVCQKMD